MYRDCAAHVAATHSFSSSTLFLFSCCFALSTRSSFNLCFRAVGFCIASIFASASWNSVLSKAAAQAIGRDPQILSPWSPQKSRCSPWLLDPQRAFVRASRPLPHHFQAVPSNGFMLDAVSSLTNHFPGFITDWLPRPHVRCRISRQPRILHGNIW